MGRGRRSLSLPSAVGRSGRRAAGDQFSEIGSTQRGSSLAGRLTCVLTGWAVMSSAEYGPRGTLVAPQARHPRRPGAG